MQNVSGVDEGHISVWRLCPSTFRLLQAGAAEGWCCELAIAVRLTLSAVVAFVTAWS